MVDYNPPQQQQLPFVNLPQTSTRVTAQWLQHVHEVLADLAAAEGRVANLEEESGNTSGLGVIGSRTVYAADPPTGLTAVAANGTTNDRNALQAVLDYVKATWGAGTVVIPAGATLKCNFGVTIPAGVQLRRSGPGAKLNFSGMTGGGAAVTIPVTTPSGTTPLHGVELIGPGGSNTLTGLSVSGSTLNFTENRITGFNRNVDLAHDNTYIITFRGGAIGQTSGVCVYNHLEESGAANAGERIVFADVVFYNSTKVFHVQTGGGSMFVDRCSIDYCSDYGVFDEGTYFFANSHFETDGNATTRNMFNIRFNSRAFFDNCNFILGGSGTGQVYLIQNPENGPVNYGNGRIRFNNCFAFHEHPVGGSGNKCSEELVIFQSGETSRVFYSPFVTKYGPITATAGANDYMSPAGGGGHAPTVFIERDGAGLITGKITVTVDPAPTAQLPVRVEF